MEEGRLYYTIEDILHVSNNMAIPTGINESTSYHTYTLSNGIVTASGTKNATAAFVVSLNNQTELTLQKDVEYIVAISCVGTISNGGNNNVYLHNSPDLSGSVNIGKLTTNCKLTYNYTPTETHVCKYISFIQSANSVWDNVRISIIITRADQEQLTWGTTEENLELIFDAISYYKDVQVHVNEDGVIASMCPETRGTLIFRKVDELVAILQFIGRTTGKIYSGSFVKNPLHFYGWFEPISLAEENADDTELEGRVTILEDAVGDITLVDHYGKDIVQILNKYTRQVLVDTSDTANQILVENYYGNIQDISYDTPIIVQVANNSVEWEQGVDDFPTITFYKEVVGEDPIEQSYKLLKINLNGSTTSYSNIDENSLTKNVFYTLIKREAELTPGNIEEIFVLLLASDAAEYGALTNRISDVEAYFDSDNLVGITDIIASGGISAASITTSGAGTIGTTLNVTGLVTALAGINCTGTLSVNGAIQTQTLNIATSVNLSSCAVSLKGSPGNSDLVNKAYVDTRDTATITTVMGKFAVGTGAPPASGTPGTFYIQIAS